MQDNKCSFRGQSLWPEGSGPSLRKRLKVAECVTLNAFAPSAAVAVLAVALIVAVVAVCIVVLAATVADVVEFEKVACMSVIPFTWDVDRQVRAVRTEV